MSGEGKIEAVGSAPPPAPLPRILAEAVHEGKRYVLQDRGGVFAVGPAFGVGRTYTTEREARIRLSEASGGVSLSLKEKSMKARKRESAVEAAEHLIHAREALQRVEEDVARGNFLAGYVAARNVSAAADRAEKLLLKAFFEGQEEPVEPTEEQVEEPDGDFRRFEASEELLAAAIQVWENRGEIFSAPGDVYPATPLGSGLLKLKRAIEKARPRT